MSNSTHIAALLFTSLLLSLPASLGAQTLPGGEAKPPESAPVTPPPTEPVAPVSKGSTVAVNQSSRALEQGGKFRLDIGVGIKGGLTGAWALEVPENQDYRINQESKAYYPQFGLGGDVGLALDVRALGIIGIETGVRVSFDNASGHNDVNQAGTGIPLVRVNQEQATTSLRIPVLIKVGSSSGTVRPTFSLGMEFVNQIDSTIDYTVEDRLGMEEESDTRAREQRNQIETSSYKLLSAAFGAEIDLGQLKIPIEFRAQYNIDYPGETFDERVRVDTTGDDPVYFYDGAYMGHVGVSIGLIYDLELLL